LNTGKLHDNDYVCSSILPLRNPVLVAAKATELTHHVSTNFQQVSCIAICKHDHVIASDAGPDLQGWNGVGIKTLSFP
jgi:predicted metal-binding protein